ncbi:major facilitator superfamily MFS_1 [Halorhabdus utahensis DSM 12940]|uniref:Major facilitator superfamily MFS_1 n=1 Tax=Halorhabdus utahensis (strain DSM 12940 / JCM 11049 / AX-2) TaxID=519442 RepID=C7NU45_HALUD|nr:MFS transporter [Halorhabdus utahensis]ACV12290.1 major facilitator superfamily MFS_1 [Halorhabdus utahensis DSM 12940]
MTDDPPTALRRQWTIVILGAIVLSGLGLQMRGAVIPELHIDFGVSMGLLGLLSPAGTLGYVIAISAVGVVAGRLDIKRWYVLGLGVIALTIVGLGFASTFLIFLGVLVVRGLGDGVVRGLDRPILSHLYPDGRGRAFGIYDLAWAVGSAAGPLVMTAAIAIGDWRLAYLGLGIALLPLVAFAWRLDLPFEQGREAVLDRAALAKLLRTREISAMALAMFFHTGIEGALFIWLPTFGIEAAGLSQPTSNLLLSAFTVAYIPGRLLSSAVADRFAYSRLLIAIQLGVLPLFYVTFFVVSGLATFPAVFALGVFVSGVYPLLVAFGTDAAPEYSAPVNAIAATASSISFALVPMVMGFVAEAETIRLAMWLPLALGVGVLPTILAAQRSISIRDGLTE